VVVLGIGRWSSAPGINGAGGGSAVARARGGVPAFYRGPTLAKAVRESTTMAWSQHAYRKAATRGWRGDTWSAQPEYGGAAVGRAAQVGLLSPWLCGAWQRGTRRGRRCGVVGPAVVVVHRRLCPVGRRRGLTRPGVGDVTRGRELVQVQFGWHSLTK
jgi:hypothetical protein